MNKQVVFVFCALLCALLAGCGGDVPGPAASPAATPTPTPAPEAAPTPTPTAEAPQMSMLSEENAPARAAYARVLKTLLNENVLPNGFEPGGGDYIGSIEDRERMAENQFAVWDVDGDGREELVLLYTTTIVAGEIGFILDYDGEADEVRIQFQEFPLFTFYENGALEVGWSHNQGKGGDFWPYTLYTYDEESDAYREVGDVDAWDKALGLEGYPEDVDVSKSGFVYYIYRDLAEEWGEAGPVDAAQYQEWLTPYVGEGREVALPYVPLTAEQIQFVVTPG